ncbi:MAG: hypothetical protein WB952_11875 [Terriglobales bacterium]
MKSNNRSFVCAALILIAAVLPASAGSTKYTYNYTESVGGVSGTTVTATFTFNSKTDQITGGKLIFTGAFDKTVSFSGACTPGSPCVFDFAKGSYSGVYTINLNHVTLASADGYVWNGKLGKKSEKGNFSYSASVPEGGSKFSYLVPAGLVIFGGIFLGGFSRPRVGNRQSV